MRELDRALADALARRDLSEAQMAAVLDEAVRGEADPVGGYALAESFVYRPHLKSLRYLLVP